MVVKLFPKIMMYLFLILNFLFIHIHSNAQVNRNGKELPNSEVVLKLSSLEGKWYINQTNFPMWLQGDKTSPTFNYSVLKTERASFLVDRVEYTKNGKQKSITGRDKPLNENNTSFIWRGKGCLRILKSKWNILHFDKKDEWAIIHFEKTLFTPKGYDIISKTRPSPQLFKCLVSIFSTVALVKMPFVLPFKIS